jgi:hypothetical protein
MRQRIGLAALAKGDPVAMTGILAGVLQELTRSD